jgi:hypothetical protein
MDGWFGGGMNGFFVGWVDWISGWVEGWMSGWMDGLMDG